MDVNFKLKFRIEIGKKIRKLRKKYQLTIEDLAELCDMSATYLQEIETGKKEISNYYFFKIMTVLCADCNEFFSNLNPPVKRNNKGLLYFTKEE